MGLSMFQLAKLIKHAEIPYWFDKYHKNEYEPGVEEKWKRQLEVLLEEDMRLYPDKLRNGGVSKKEELQTEIGDEEMNTEEIAQYVQTLKERQEELEVEARTCQCCKKPLTEGIEVNPPIVQPIEEMQKGIFVPIKTTDWSGIGMMADKQSEAYKQGKEVVVIACSPACEKTLKKGILFHSSILP
jgi:hypothetical protein